MSKGLLVALLCAAYVFSSNEAGRMSMTRATMTLRARWKQQQAAMRRTMTTERALEVVPKVLHTSPDVVSLIQSKLGVKQRVGKQYHTTPGNQGNSDSDYEGGTNVALARINDMMLETIEKHDFEDIRCHDYNQSQLLELSEIQEDRKILETLGEAAASDKSNAFAKKNEYQEKVDSMNTEIKKWRSQCEREEKELQQQYDVASGDLNTMLKVLKMVECNSPSSFLQVHKDGKAVMLQCTNKITGKTYQRLEVRDEKMKRALVGMKHPKVVQLVSEALGQVPGMPGFLPAAVNPTPEMAAEKCSLANSTKCGELRERFLNIQGGIEDTVSQISHFQAAHRLRCEHTEENMKSELALYIASVDRYTVLEKKAVETMGEYDLQMQEKNTQYEQTSKELSDELSKCDELIKELVEEHCALGQIRGELLKMEKLPNEVTDCEVTEWTAQECSSTCGGGTRTLTRFVTVHTDGGHHCPPLSMQQSCNTQRCPLNCVTDDWSGWGPCSAFCNGGVEERLRKIRVHNTPGGDACPQTSETQECHLDACDADCELHDWSSWSATCSKVCGGGRQTRNKHLKKPERGTGTCPVYHDVSRFESRPCNTQICKFDDTKQVVCDAKVDVILLMDGSGSLGEQHYADIKAAAKKLTLAMGNQSSVAALVFSGPSWEREEHPSWWGNWFLCSGYDWAEEEFGGFKGTDPNEVCGMKWASTMDTDKAKVVTAIDQATYPGWFTFTHTALKLAGEELRFGRSDAQSVIITITDGVPSWADKTEHAAAEVMKKARLMWVPAGVPETEIPHFDHLASEPANENVLSIADINRLADNLNIDKLVTGFCPQVHFVDRAE